MLYYDVPSSAESCFIANADPINRQVSCNPWANPPSVVVPGTAPNGLSDYCVLNGNGAPTPRVVNPVDLSSLIGFKAVPVTDQLSDPTTGTTCATTSESSKFGLLLKGAPKNGFCITGWCGMQHGYSFGLTNVRPWYANGQLVFGAIYDPVAFKSGAWRSYMCPWVRDQGTSNGFQLCEETWRSDSYSGGSCGTPDTNGINICWSGKVIGGVCILDATGFNECVSPNFKNGGQGIVFTRPQAGTKLATNNRDPYVGAGILGLRHYMVTITQVNLIKFAKLFNIALRLYQRRGQFLTSAPFSLNPSDYVVGAFEYGNEGANFGGSSTDVGSNISKISEAIQY